MEADFWSKLDGLLESARVVIDRPAGTPHPRYPELVYPLDYGYLDGTTGSDGNGIDVWVGTAGHRQLTAIAATVDILKKDAEIKLIIGCTEEDIRTLRAFYDGKFMSAVIIRRNFDR